MTDEDAVSYLPEIHIRSRRTPTAEPTAVQSEEALNRFCILLSDAGGAIKTSIAGLEEEAKAMGVALEALDRILDTLKICSERALSRLEPHAKGQDQPSDLARPLRLAASTALAVNANIAASSNALAEASLRIIRAGEHFIEASRLAPAALSHQRPAADTGNAQRASASRLAR